ncbi:MAG: MFS transporter [Alphaproteobacteria bacterium]|nr:MFS transporter [Alphaproteobacteria bacterium]
MSQTKTLNWAVTAGHIVECFDTTLYGFFAVMLAPIFFPSSSHSVELLVSFGAFAAGFLARPIGAIIFGFIGDKYGRKKPLLWSIMLVGIPTIGIGLTPTYQTLGIMAPILLIVFRLLQGLLWGGEFTGVNLYNAETSIKSRLGTRSGILISAGVFGAVLATAVGALVSMETMPTWAWRVPFLVGGVFAFFIYLFRREISETEDFLKAKQQQSLLLSPWKELLTNHKKHLFLAVLIAGLDLMPLYLSSIFGNQLFSEVGYSDSQCMLFNMLSMITCGALILFTGRLADKIGFQKQMQLGTVLIALFSLPAFYLISQTELHAINIALFIIILVMAGTVMNCCYMPYIARFFPTNCRYSGVALSVTIGQAVFGGTAPLVGSFLIDYTGTKMAPAFWLIALSIASAIGVYTRRNDLAE